MLDLIYNQILFNVNSLGWQLTTSQFFQPLTPLTSALVAAAIHCALSEYATGKKVTDMFLKMNIEVNFDLPWWLIALLQKSLHLFNSNYTWWGYFLPPPMVLLRYNWRSSILLALLNPCWHSSILSALLSLDWCCEISFSAPYFFFCLCSSCTMGTLQSPPQPRLGAPQFDSRLFTSLLFWPFSPWMGCSAE